MEEMGLEYVFDRPLAGVITRLTYQKGIELMQNALPDLLSARDFSVVVLGSGEDEYEQFFQWLQTEFPGRVGFYQGFNNQLAHRIDLSNPQGVRAQMSTELDVFVADFIKDNDLNLTRDERQRLVQGVIDEVAGFGPIEPLLADSTITEVMAALEVK